MRLPFCALPARPLVLACLIVSSCFARAQLTFSFHHAPSIDPRALAGYQVAAARWSSLLNDPINVALNLRFEAFNPMHIGSAAAMRETFSYASFRQALAADSRSSADASAVASLPEGNYFDLLTNRTTENPHGVGSPVPYLDNNGSANNARVLLTLPNARALGLYQATGGLIDATISINSLFAFDFDPSDGVDVGTFDFVALATHEIGHALGFTSGVDSLDSRTTVGSEDSLTAVMPLDLFRFSNQSAASGAIDWTADDRDKFFSIDGGLTSLALFSTGNVNGDGLQASHWKAHITSGIMTPTHDYGEHEPISPLDLLALDVIGYGVAVPEPATYGSAGVLVLAALVLARRRSPRRTR